MATTNKRMAICQARTKRLLRRQLHNHQKIKHHNQLSHNSNIKYEIDLTTYTKQAL